VLALVWLAFALRIYRLDSQPLWIDEGVSLCRSELPGGDDQENPSVCLSAGEQSLYYSGLAVTRLTAGDSVLAIRLVGVWASTMTVALLYVSNRRLFGRAAGLGSALVATVSPYWVWNAQAANPHTWGLAAAVLSVWALARLISGRQPNAGRAAIWIASCILVVAIAPAAFWMLLVELLALATWALRKELGRPYLPWMLLAVTVIALTAVASGVLVANYDLFRPTWTQVREVIRPSVAGGTSTILVALRLAPLVALGVSSLAWLTSRPRRARQWVFVFSLLLVPCLAMVARNLPGNDPDWVLLLVPAGLLAGAGGGALWRDWRVGAVMILLGAAAVNAGWLVHQFHHPSFARDDLRAAARYLTDRVQEQDIVVLHNARVLPVWRYYYHGSASVEVIPPAEGGEIGQVLERFQSVADSHCRVWFVSEPTPANTFDPGLLPYHAESRWVKFEAKDFTSPWLKVKVEGYTAEPPIVVTVPAAATPTNICWAGGLCLQAWSASNLVPGDSAQLTFYWMLRDPAATKYKVYLAIGPDDSPPYVERSESVLRFYPVTRWPTNRILQQTVEIALSPALPPTEMIVSLGLEDQATGQRLRDDADQTSRELGRVQVSRPAAPIKATALSLSHRTDADFGETLRLLGYNLPLDNPRPGHSAFVDFYWQVLVQPTEDWQQRTRLVGRDGKVWAETVGSLGLATLSLPDCRRGDLMWRRAYLQLPGQMPAGEYKLEVALLQPNGATVPATEMWRSEVAQAVMAGPMRLDDWLFVATPALMPHRPDTLFGNAVRLAGADIQGIAAPGESLKVSLSWRSEMALDKDYHVFVHLMDGNDVLLTQSDGMPASWTRPTSSWRPGEHILDEHTLVIPDDAPQGPVYVWVGLYAPDGSGRLPVDQPPAGQPSDRTLLDILVVEPLAN